MKPGQIILAMFPTSGGGFKARPCLVVSSGGYNRRGSDVVVVAISSNVSRSDPEDIPILDNHPAFSATKLRVSSVLRCGKLYTFDRKGKYSLLGVLSAELLEEVNERWRSLLGLA